MSGKQDGSEKKSCFFARERPEHEERRLQKVTNKSKPCKPTTYRRARADQEVGDQEKRTNGMGLPQLINDRVDVLRCDPSPGGMFTRAGGRRALCRSLTAMLAGSDQLA